MNIPTFGGDYAVPESDFGHIVFYNPNVDFNIQSSAVIFGCVYCKYNFLNDSLEYPKAWRHYWDKINNYTDWLVLAVEIMTPTVVGDVTLGFCLEKEA